MLTSHLPDDDVGVTSHLPDDDVGVVAGHTQLLTPQEALGVGAQVLGTVRMGYGRPGGEMDPRLVRDVRYTRR